MNANCYKIVFSKRLGALVAVGEHATSAGKQASGQGTRHTLAAVAFACLTVGGVQAQPTLSATALPTSSQVSTGKVTMSTQGANMAINQTSDKASVNWDSFNIGSAATVNVTQPSANAVLLNRVIGNDPSQILGKLNANGQVILLNPNGIVFGQSGSVTASAFTASTFGLSDEDFMAGYYKYTRNGSTAAVVNQGTIETASGGYVALIGATVTNEGKIIAPQGDVVLAGAESVTLPEALVKPQAPSSPNTISVRMSKRVRLELDPATVNTAVNNTSSGVIVTEGGQVLLQAAAISTAVASVTHSGQIDTSSSQQAGAVTVLADNGNVKVDGSIKANSSGNDGQSQTRKGGDIIIGRDEETGALAKVTDVSGAQLESQAGFVETSGLKLVTDKVQVKANHWLLDPIDIEINNAGAATQATYSQISNSTINSALNNGTAVTIETTGSGSVTGIAAPAFTGTNGRILVSGALSKTNTNTTASLTLTADTQIDVNNTITNSAGKLALTLIAPTVNSSSTATISGVNLAVNNTINGTLAGVISNSGSFTKNGAGTLSLTGANTYTGATAVKTGTLQVTKMGTFKSSSIAIDAGAVFDANTTSTALNTSDTTVTGAGTFKKTGSAMLTLTGANSLTAMTFGSTFTGLIDIREGTLQNDGTRGNLQNNQGSINIESGAALDIRTQNVRMKGLSGAGNIVNTWSNPTPTIEIGYGTTSTDTYLFTGIIGAKVGAANSSPFNLSKSGSGTQILSGDNIYVGTTAINSGTLQIGDSGTTGKLGTGAVTLASNANLRYNRSADTSIANVISGTGNVYADISGVGNLSVDNTISLTGSTSNNKIDLRANGNLTLSKAISTSNNTGDAIKLVAGRSLASGDSSGGNIIVNGTGAITMASGGIATLYSGSVAGTTGISSMASSGSGKFRYNSDETTTNYTLALSQSNGASNSGVSIIYREDPAIELTANSVLTGLTYNANAQTGVQGVTNTTAAGILQNGDPSAQLTGTLAYAYDNNGDINHTNAGTYAITATGQTSALGYRVNYVAGSLVIAQKSVSLSAGKTYDGSYALTGNQLTIATGVGTETLGYSSATIHSKDVGNNSTNYVDAVTFIDGLNGGKASNYTFTAARSANNTVALTAKEVSLSASKDYDGGATLSGNQLLITTGVGTEILTYSGATILSKNVSDNATNYVNAVTLGNGANGGLSGNYTFTAARSATNTVSLSAKQVGLSAIKEYDGVTTLTGSQLTITTGVGAETLSFSGATLHSKNVADNASNYVETLTLLDGTNGGISTNYTFTPAPSTNNAVALSKAGLTLTANSDTNNKIYNGTEQSVSGFSITSGSLKGTDTLSDLASISAIGKGTNAGTYASAVDDTAYTNGNYAITKVDGSFVIAKKEVALSVAKEYDGVTSLSGNQLSIITGVGQETLSFSSATTDSKNVADNAINYVDAVTLSDGSHGGLANNYKLPALTNAVAGKNTVAITPAPLTLTANSDTKTYNGTEQSITGFTITNGSLKGSDTITVDLAGISAGGKGTNSGAYTTAVTDSAYTHGNYVITKVAGTLVITTKQQISDNGTTAKEKDPSEPKRTERPPFLRPQEPALPSSSENSNSDSNSVADNPYLVLPQRRTESVDRCNLNAPQIRNTQHMPDVLDGCLCEAQPASGIEGLAICYEPQKTANTQTTRRSPI
jgi:filamentous hemagglutinin family protein